MPRATAPSHAPTPAGHSPEGRRQEEGYPEECRCRRPGGGRAGGGRCGTFREVTRCPEEGRGVRDSVAHSCRIRLRPILMTSLATVVGLLPMALKLESGSEAYAPLARVIIGGLIASVALTIFVVPAAYLWVYQRGEASASPAAMEEVR